MGRANRMLLRVASFGALGGFLFGYDLALIGGALLYMEEDLFLTELEIELIVGGAKFGAVFGTFVGGALMSCYGRRNAIVVDGLFYIVGPLLMAVSGSVLGLVVGRLVVGVGVGISAVVVPTYVAEMAPANSRGAMVTIYELMLCLGMLCASLMDFALKDWPGNWRWMVGVPALPAVLLLTTKWLLPESPRWLVHHGYMRKALAAIHSLRSDTRQSFLDSSCAEVEDELLELWSSVEMELDVMRAKLREREARRRARQQKMPSPQAGTQGREKNKIAPPAELSAVAAKGGSASSASGTNVDDALTEIPLEVEEVQLQPELSSQVIPPIASTSQDHLTCQTDGSMETSRGSDAAMELQEEHHALSPVHAKRRRENEFWPKIYDMVRSIRGLAKSNEGNAFYIALWLAFFDQATASTAIINFAPKVLEETGVEDHSEAIVKSSLIGATKMAGVGVSLFLIDSLGRKPLLIAGGLGCAASMVLLTIAVEIQNADIALAAMCMFLFSFSASWASGFWVLVSEMFSMNYKAAATSAATALLFLTGALTNVVFLSLARALGSGAFLIFGGIALVSAIYVHVVLPETKGRRLADVQALLRDSGMSIPGLGHVYRKVCGKLPRKSSAGKFQAFKDAEDEQNDGVVEMHELSAGMSNADNVHEQSTCKPPNAL